MVDNISNSSTKLKLLLKEADESYSIEKVYDNIRRSKNSLKTMIYGLKNKKHPIDKDAHKKCIKLDKKLEEALKICVEIDDIQTGYGHG
jgi:hypothetical protein